MRASAALRPGETRREEVLGEDLRRLVRRARSSRVVPGMRAVRAGTERIFDALTFFKEARRRLLN